MQVAKEMAVLVDCGLGNIGSEHPTMTPWEVNV